MRVAKRLIKTMTKRLRNKSKFNYSNWDKIAIITMGH